jgi:PAS domain S-box-containing protein
VETVPIDVEQAHLHYRLLADNALGSAVFILDRSLCLQFVGGALPAQVRDAASLLLGRPFAELIGPPAFAVAAPHLDTALQGRQSCYEAATPTGEIYQICMNPLRGEDGSVAQILVVALDISRQKRTEETQRADQQRLLLAVHAANVGLWDWDLRTNRVHYWPEWKQQLGYTDAEISDDFVEWESRVHPDDLDRARTTALTYTTAPWPNYQQEFRMRHKDGSYRWILAQAALYYDADGKPAHMFGSHIDITEKKRAEEVVRESAARYRSLFENSNSVMLLIDAATGEIVDANPAAAAYYGWTRAELCQINIFTIDASPRAKIEAEIARTHAAGRNYFMFRHRLADGTLRDVEVYSSPVELDGRVLRYSIVHDVTQRKQAEEALQRSETALKRSQATAHIGHWSWDTRSNTVTWSDEMKRIFGLDPATFQGDLDQVIAHTVHPADAERLREMNAAVLHEQRTDETEYRVVWQDGSIHYVRATPADQVLDADGHIVQLAGVVQDITQRKLTEMEREQLLDQLQNKAEQLAQVMRSVPEGVLLLDSSGSVLLANPLADQALSLLAAFDEEQRLVKLGGVALDALLTSPPPGQWHTLQEGRRIYELMARPVESGPVPAGWVLVLRNVTAERAAQEQLHRQERLAAVGQLAAGIAHDFNNIMSVITIYAELVGDMPEISELARTRTTTIINQAMRATRMIRQILDFSRQSVLERQMLDLLPLLKEQEKLLKQTLPENIEIDLSYTRGEFFVRADPTRMQQLIMNLAVNARDAMPQGGQLRIALERFQLKPGERPLLPELRQGEWLRIDVQDTGTGIQNDILPHIFEPFFTTKEPGKGTGLGLAQAHGIVAQHDGYVLVSSEPGLGTTFSIFLPAHAVGGTGAMAARAALPQGQGERVLIVEDDAVLRATLMELLTLWNYTVVAATNGEEAIALLIGPDDAGENRNRSPKFDAVLSDVVMPRLGGIGLVKALRLRGLHTPVILMSGHPMGEERVGLSTLGVAAWLDKPPDSGMLAEAVATAVKGHNRLPR